MKTIKKIKTTTVLLCLMALFVVPIQSCQKYPDGPFISFRTRTTRLSQTWKVDNAKKNDNDYTSFVSSYTETYTKGHDYSYVWGLLGGTGTWSFQNSDKEVSIVGVSNQASHTLYLLKLEEGALWYYYMDGSDKYEFHMIPK
jgi:hypothetical protein